MDSRQFGKKIGKHAQDFGLNPKDENDREKMRSIINDIIDNHDEVRRGWFRGQSGDVDFYIKGRDVVLVNNGEFVSIFKDGIDNPTVKATKRKG